MFANNAAELFIGRNVMALSMFASNTAELFNAKTVMALLVFGNNAAELLTGKNVMALSMFAAIQRHVDRLVISMKKDAFDNCCICYRTFADCHDMRSYDAATLLLSSTLYYFYKSVVF
jgi:hypothetical protein